MRRGGEKRGDDRIEGSALLSRGGHAMSASCPPHKSAVEEMHTIPICLPACPSACPRAARRRHGCLGAHGPRPRRSSAFQTDRTLLLLLLLHSAQSGAAEKMTSELTLCMHRSALSVHSSFILLIFILRDAPLLCPPFIQDRVAAMIILDGKYPHISLNHMCITQRNESFFLEPINRIRKGLQKPKSRKYEPLLLQSSWSSDSSNPSFP